MINVMSDSKFNHDFYQSIVIAANEISRRKYEGPKSNYIILNPKLNLIVSGWLHESFDAYPMHQYVEWDDFDDDE
jgi:hypothetical protein